MTRYENSYIIKSSLRKRQLFKTKQHTKIRIRKET
nr:MAG TPA: hypothetical protein [Caudoviricetes sp.]